MIRPATRSLSATLLELLSSMRFAISLLSVIAIASVIGTIVKQNEPQNNYINQFGPFWFEVFDKLSFYTVYSAWWFVLILAFLVVSTSLCVIRNSPKMLADMRSWKDKIQENGLRAFHHHAEVTLPGALETVARSKADVLLKEGYRLKAVEHGQALLLTAKRGAANKLGYIFAHCAIVIICLGGLLDGDLFIRAEMWLGNKEAFKSNAVISQIPEKHRLPLSNPSFRGNALVAEGGVVNTAVINYQDGVLIQDLPFTIKLKKFIIEHYSTGMPKLFASEVEVTDHDTGKVTSATVKVNEPLIHKGMAIYQSSFEDGGSHLTLSAFPMQGSTPYSFEIKGDIGGTGQLGAVENRWQTLENADQAKAAQQSYTLEFTGFRPFNVENVAQENDTRAVAQPKGESKISLFESTLDSHLGSGTKTQSVRELRNVGPSVQYKLRDKAGQAREFNNYMLPATIDQQRVFLLGMRDSPAEQFRFLRIPADQDDSLQQWLLFRAAMANSQWRDKAAQRFAESAMAGEKPELRQQLKASALKTLDLFAGVQADGSQGKGGYQSMARFIEKTAAKDEQQRAADIFLKILSGAAWELWQVARSNAGLPAVEGNEENGRFLQSAINALSDSYFYEAPVLLQLKAFDEVKASVFQITRSPGKKIVYLGCLLLVLGVFSMFYVRERRVWVWLKPGSAGGTQLLMAMSSQRKTLDFDKEFVALKTLLTAE